MNHMIHIAAISQIRLETPGRAYFRRKQAAGKTKLEALRTVDVAAMPMGPCVRSEWPGAAAPLASRLSKTNVPGERGNPPSLTADRASTDDHSGVLLDPPAPGGVPAVGDGQL